MNRRFLETSLIYGAVQWAGPFVTLVLTPILTRILDPSDYGVSDFVMTVAAGIGTIALFGLPQALTAHFNDRPGDPEWRRSITGSALALSAAIGLTLALVLMTFARPIAQWAWHDTRHAFLFQIAAGTLLFSAINSVMTRAAQAALQSRWVIAIGLTSVVATAVGNVGLIVILRLGVAGMVLVPAAAGIALTAAIAILMRPMVGRMHWGTTRLLFRSGTILLPAAAAAWILQAADRLFLVHIVSTQELGYYAIANRIAALIHVLVAPVATAWTALALAAQHDPGERARSADGARHLISLALFGALALGLFAREILAVFTRLPYLPAAPYVGFLAYVHVITAVGTVLSATAMMRKQLGVISWSVIGGAAVNMLLNYLLIPSYGLWGATIATVVGFAAQPVLLYIALRRGERVEYPMRKLLVASVVQLGLLVAGMAVAPMPAAPRIAVKLGLLASLVAAFAVLDLITPLELAQTRLFFRRQLRSGRAG